MQKFRIDATFILFGALILCTSAFLNKFPFVYPDTGTYLRSGFEDFLSDDRPIFYGIFASHVSLASSLWLVILAQGLLVSWLVHRTLAFMLIRPMAQKLFCAIIVLLTLTTHLSDTVSILIPDIFTPIAILCLANLLLDERISRRSMVALSITFVFSMMVHLSNLMVIAGTLIILGIWWIASKKTRGLIAGRRLILAGISAIAALILVPTLHYAIGNKFQFSRGGHVFMMNHLLETGILEEFLHANCEQRNYRICEFRDNMGWDFLWNPESPVHRTGGWEANREEYNKIIKEVVTTPRHAIMLFQKGIEYSAIQFFYINTEPPWVQLQESAPYYQMEAHFKHNMREYHSSRQNNSRLRADLTNDLQLIVTILSWGFLFILFMQRQAFAAIPTVFWNMLIVITLAIVINCILCANLSTIDPRFQVRVVWLFPMMAALLLAIIARPGNLRNS
jgi:hypothetical protein